MSNRHEIIARRITETADMLIREGYDYLIIAGRDGVCARYASATNGDLGDMLGQMAHEHPVVARLLIESLVNAYETDNTTLKTDEP